MEIYIVKKDDTLSKIASREYGDWTKYKIIAHWNGIKNPDDIKAGQRLTLHQNPNDWNPVVSVRGLPIAGEIELTFEDLKQILPRARNGDIALFLEPLKSAMAEADINTPLRAAHFIAQLAHESGDFRFLSENLNYSRKALLTVFSKYFKNEKKARDYARNPQKIANLVYGNRMGNILANDGFDYRGRGLIMITGRSNYAAFSIYSGVDVVQNPAILAGNPVIAASAAA